MSLPGAFWRGMGQRPMLPLCRATCPTPGAQGHQRARSAHASDATRHGLGFAPVPQALPLDAGRPRSAENRLISRLKDRRPAARREARAGRRPHALRARCGAYSLIQGIKSRKPRQHWLSGRLLVQKTTRKRGTNGTTKS